jgi:hypothetical protein
MDEYQVLSLAKLISLKSRNELYHALSHGKIKAAVLEDIEINSPTHYKNKNKN